MAKQRHALTFAALAAVLGIALYLWGFRRTPEGQPPLVSLNAINVGEYQRAFDNAAGQARLLVLVSPT